MKRGRWGVFRTSTWFLGFQTHRTNIAPWENQTDVFVIPGLGISFQWKWHCDDCRAKYDPWFNVKHG